MMKIKPILCLVLASTAFAVGTPSFAGPAPRVSFTTEEFIGPFASWGNVKSYGAKGDGVTDDTAAIQRALDNMNLFVTNQLGWKIEKPGSPSMLYFPAGTYRITKSLKMYNEYGAGIVGEDPARTKIVWGGAAGGTMLIADGVFGGKYARLTWDGKGKAAVGVAHWWDKRTPQFGASPEHVDEVFTDMGVGIVAGCCGTSSTPSSHPFKTAAYFGNMDSEGSVKRTKFVRMSVAGVSMESPNALNWWVMDSEFIDNYRGLTNSQGAGNVHSYRNLFRGSRLADVHVNYVQWHSMQGNVSIGSRRFLEADKAGNNGRSLILRNNRIVNSTDPSSVYVGNLGPLMMIDNQFLSTATSTGPVVQQRDNAWTPGRDLIAVSNQYTVPAAQQILLSDLSKDRLIKLHEETVARSAISSAVPVMPPTPVNQNRRVFEVPLTIDSRTKANLTTSTMIQAVINAAAASSDPHPVVHFPRGTYTIDRTLTVPAGRRIQLAGDGLATLLKKGSKLGNSPMLRLNGPSKATVREMRFFSSDFKGTAIAVEKADQHDGRVLLNGTMAGGTNISNLASTRVEFQHTTAITRMNATAAGSVLSLGAGVVGPVAVNANSGVVMLDTWFEGKRGNTLIRGDSGTFTYLGGHIAPPDVDESGAKAGPQIVVDNFAGQFTVAGLSFQIKTRPDGTLENKNHGILVNGEHAATKALFLGVSGNPVDYYYRRAQSGGKVGFGWMRTNRTTAQDNKGATDNAAILEGLSQVRSVSFDRGWAAIPAGATDVNLYRVRTTEIDVGFDIKGK
jgi:hypothetical protein